MILCGSGAGSPARVAIADHRAGFLMAGAVVLIFRGLWLREGRRV